MFRKFLFPLLLLFASLLAVAPLQAAESVLFVQPTNSVPIPALLDSSNYLYVNCPACTGLAAPTGLNNADASVSVGTGLTTTQDFLYGYNGTTWDRLRLDSSKNLDVNCIVGCSGGSFNNNADGVATSATNGQAAAWNYLWNGATWDRLKGDTTNGAFVNVKTSVLPALAATSTKQSDGTQKTQIVDGSGNVVGQSTPTQLDVTCKTGCGTTQVTATTTQTGPTITTGLTFQSLAASSGSRKGCTIQNPSTATEPLFIFFGATGSATTSNSFMLSPGQAISCISGPVVLTDNIAATATTTGHALILAVQ